MSARTRRIPGIVSLAVSLLGLGLTAAGIVIASASGATETSWAVATILAVAANVATAAGAVAGLVCAIAGWGRVWGVLAVIVGVLSNPWLQVTVLGALS